MAMEKYPQRKSTRLKDYDYRQNGAYFVTICTFRSSHLFGVVVDDAMMLNECGRIAADEWRKTAELRPNVLVDMFVVMPNHTHAIIVIFGDDETTKTKLEHQNTNDRRGAMHCAPTKKRGATKNNVAPNSLGAIVRGYKAAVTRQINRLPQSPDQSIWQRNYYDRIIRDERSLNEIRRYIYHNPAQWTADEYYSS